MELSDLSKHVRAPYEKLQNAQKAFYRDLNGIISLGAITAARSAGGKWRLELNLEWPSQTTESDFMERVKTLPIGKMHKFL
jgi:4-hydroxyphenylpyruvate dioxygenase-like putative hemolysin